MLSATHLKRQLQATATAAISIAMLAFISQDTAQAVNLKTFNISGNFAPTAAEGSLGLPVSLENGSFNGTYTVDVDQLPAPNSFVNLTSWNVNLFGKNGLLRSLSNNLTSSSAYIQENTLAFSDAGLLTGENQNLYSLELYFNNNFTGRGITNNGIFLDNSDLSGVQSFGSNAVTFASSQPIPEPRTFGEMIVAVSIGVWISRRRKKVIAP
ncbi:PEP-CTERM sorting domain-containing protein [Nostoc sp. MS1]|uniref:PEP-CTERM sorting domain-containing protein n=1 Tax=Nostoc sp. MS1 TaxID=2764711 RepID=UPI001CC3BB06|nr:PEP-CTERM sorting domain-containing protein [Nostoc sp. MS1]BCL38046.1 hypothetical protein NSMS1_44930 [Nostoc sp. MS1]